MKAFNCVVGGLMLSCLTLLAGCNFEMKVSTHSGTTQDDDAEEQLPSLVKKYEPALLASNDILDNLIARRHQAIWDTRFAPSLQKEIDGPGFQAMMERVEAKLGPIRSYKRMQWAFDHGEDRGVKYVVSSKIVHYEKGALNFRFVFPVDGPYERILGFHTKLRQTQSPK